MARVLIGCEFSGVVRDAFIAAGHDAVSCDLLPSERPGPHLQRDIRDVIGQFSWDLAIFHPPCTYLTNAGVRWLYVGDKPTDGRKRTPDAKRWRLMEESAKFFDSLLDANIPRICIENPIMHSHATKFIRQPYAQVIQPWQFGHPEVKATCLWLKNLPPLKPTNIVAGRTPRVHFASPGPERWKERSRTLPGLADALASQWGPLL